MTDPWLLLSYGRGLRPAGDVSTGAVPVLGALGAGLNTATAAVRADRDLADRRALADLMTGAATLGGQQQVSQAEAERVLRIAVAEALLRSQAAQAGRPPSAPSPAPPPSAPSPAPPPSAPSPAPRGAAASPTFAAKAAAVAVTGVALAAVGFFVWRRR